MIFLKAIVLWMVFIFIGTNLLGLIVRGFLQSPIIDDDASDRGQALLAKEKAKGDIGMGIITLLACAGYFYAINHYGNIYLVLCAVFAMIIRLPDLLWEIQTSRKVTAKEAPQGIVYTLAAVGMWILLPLIWASLLVK
jgi:hypothetical protein